MKKLFKKSMGYNIVYACELILTIAGIVFTIINIVTKNYVEFGASLSAIAAGVAPFLFERVIKKRFPLALHWIYFIYIFFSNIIGSNLEVFDQVWWYDKFMHAILGYVLCILAVYVLAGFKQWGKNRWFEGVMIFSFSMMYASCWELLEWSADTFLNQNMQHGLQDTMLDIGWHFVTTIIFLLQFALYANKKFCFGMNYMWRSLDKKIENAKSESLKAEDEKVENNE